MTQWPTVRLGEAVELAYGKSLPKNSRAEGNIPVYGSNGIAGWHDTALVNAPTIIVGRKGSAGAVQYVTNPCFPIDTTYFVRVREKFDYDIQYLFYLLRKLDLSRLKTATGVPGLTREDAYQELIPVPSIAEQKRIVDILTRAEGIVRLRREAQKKAAEIIPALFVDMFGDPATNPKGWPTQPLCQLAKLVSGGTPSKSREDFWVGNLPWVSPKDMKVDDIADSIDHVHEKTVAETSLKLIPTGSVLIVVRGMILAHTVPVARNLVPITINQDMKAIIPDESINPVYLQWLLKVLQPKLLNEVSTAAHGTRKLETSCLENLIVPVPPIDSQNRFMHRVTDIQSICSSQNVAFAKAEDTFNSLLAGLFK